MSSECSAHPYSEKSSVRNTGTVGRLRVQNLKRKKKQWKAAQAHASPTPLQPSTASSSSSASSATCCPSLHDPNHINQNTPPHLPGYVFNTPSSPPYSPSWGWGAPMYQHHVQQHHHHHHHHHQQKWFKPQQSQMWNQNQQGGHQMWYGMQHAQVPVVSPTNTAHMMIPQPNATVAAVLGNAVQQVAEGGAGVASNASVQSTAVMSTAAVSELAAVASSSSETELSSSSSVNTSSVGELTPTSTPGSEPLPKISSPSMMCLPAPVSVKPIASPRQEPQLLFDQELLSVTRMKGTDTMPTPRFGHTAVVHEDVMVVFGGRDGKCNDDLWTYNFLTKTWRHMTTSSANGNGPKPRAGHTAVVMDGKMLMFGGVAESSAGMHSCWLNDLWSLDLTTFKWSIQRSKGSRLPGSRKGHTAVTHKHSMFVFGGGQDDMSLNNDLWEYNSATSKWVSRRYSGHTPKERMYHVAAVNKDSMVVFGGRAAVKTGFLNDVFEVNLVDFVSRQLKTSGPSPTQRMCSTAVCHNGVFSVFTGGSLSYLDDSYQLDLHKLEWSCIEEVSCGGRTRPTTVRWRNKLLTFGGCVNGGYVNDAIEVELAPRTLASYTKQFILERHIPFDPKEMPESLLALMRR